MPGSISAPFACTSDMTEPVLWLFRIMRELYSFALSTSLVMQRILRIIYSTLSCILPVKLWACLLIAIPDRALFC